MERLLFEREWSVLPFAGYDETKRRLWEKAAAEILDLDGNIGVVGDTGTGKTMVAILVLLARSKRAVFFAPTTTLADDQHADRYGKITGRPEEARVIVGETGRNKRDWQDPAARVFFATPETFWAEFRAGKFDIRSFDLFVFDEFHLATGKYVYVDIAGVAQQYGIARLGLSASPGGTEERIEEVRRNCGLDRFYRLDIRTPAKIEDRIEIRPTEAQLETERLFSELMLRAALRLAHCGVKVEVPPKMRPLVDLFRKELPRWRHDDRYFRAMRAVVECLRARHAYAAALTESFYTFLEFDRKLAARTANRNVRQLVSQPEWREAAAIARREIHRHPKAEEFLRVAAAYASRSARLLAFVNNRATARYLVHRLDGLGVRGAAVFGRKDQKTSERKSILEKFGGNELEIIVSTSALEVGVDVPAVDLVCHYSMPLTEVARVQRSGRTARSVPGEVLYLVLDHYLDRAMYWTVKRKERTMRETVGGRPQAVMRRRRPELPLFDE